MLPLEILLSSIDRVVNRVGSCLLRLGLGSLSFIYIVSLRRHPLPARIQKFLTQRIELMVISVEELKTEEL